MTRLVLVLPMLLALAACESAEKFLETPPQPLGAKLDGEQIRSLFEGNTLVLGKDEVPPFSVYFGKDDELKGLRANNYADTGSWRIEGDTVCGAWDNWLGTLARCWTVHRNGSTLTLSRVDDSQRIRGSVVTGKAL